MPTVVMKGSSASVAGKRKRMPGANHTYKPEVKAYDPLHSNPEPGIFNSVDIANFTIIPTAASASFYGSNFPIGLNHPVAGTNIQQRIGWRYFLKFLKFKGYIYVRVNNPWTIHWRLVLIRTSNVDQINFPTQYYTYYQNANLLTPSDLSQGDVDTVMSHARHNFYKKMNDPNNNKIFRRKVIASGVIPAMYHHTSTNSLAISGNPGLVKNQTMTTWGVTNGSAMWMPINVTVKCNDNIDIESDKYWLVLENDVGVGLDYQMAWNISNTSYNINDCRSVSNIGWRVFGANFYCKAYFTDT